jgi:hypothetical protein
MKFKIELIGLQSAYETGPRSEIFREWSGVTDYRRPDAETISFVDTQGRKIEIVTGCMTVIVQEQKAS